MTVDYKTDDEKVEELKGWVKENGLSVAAGIALAVAGLFGWEYWKGHQVTTSAEASAIAATVAKVDAATLNTAVPNVETLQKNFASTPYAASASLKLAQQYAEKGNYEQAATELRWVADNGKEDALKPVARLRLGRVLLAMGKADEALNVANQTYPAAYQSLVEELKGDVFASQQKIAEARAAYDKAMTSTGGQESGSTEFIKLKRDNLGEG
jgi:predicted negative regulator of RcsB-dependent stress response